MAHVEAFKGLRYNSQIIQDLSLVVTPPYDVISPEEQESFYRTHPRNIIRLILGRQYASDTEADNRYTRAAADFQAWRENGVLIHDPGPALYLYRIEYTVEDGTKEQRTGLIARVKVEDIQDGKIRRHERTFSETKSDRLKLIKACRANFSPIFSLYSDPERSVSNLLQSAAAKTPVNDFRDKDGIRHMLWPVTEAAALQGVSQWFDDRDLFIADGHHRYETAVNYWNFLKETEGAKEGHPAQYVMMYLCNTEENVTILPAHRLLAQWPSALDVDDFLESCEKFFEIKSFEYAASDRDDVRARFFDVLKEAGESAHAFGFTKKGMDRYFLFTMKPGVMEGDFGRDLKPAQRDLDVAAFTEVIFKGLLGMTDEDLDNEKNLHYSSRYHDALDKVETGRCEAGFLLNPTRIEQVTAVAGEGLIMPRKSTYFYPKVITGMVINAF